MLADILFLCGSQNLVAQTATDSVYVFLEDQPDAGYFLPAPPDSVSTEFIDDLIQWEWGKKQRSTQRGEQASRESLWMSDIMRTVMAEVLELDTISDEATPALSRLLTKAYNTSNLSTIAAKEKHMRTRPFVMMNAPTARTHRDTRLSDGALRWCSPRCGLRFKTPSCDADSNSERTASSQVPIGRVT